MIYVSGEARRSLQALKMYGGILSVPKDRFGLSALIADLTSPTETEPLPIILGLAVVATRDFVSVVIPPLYENTEAKY